MARQSVRGIPLALLVALSVVPAPAQEPSALDTPFPVLADPIDLPSLLGGVPSGPLADGELELTLAQAVARGLAQNLALLLDREAVRAARGARRQTRAELLPELVLEVAQSRRKINLAATGFSSLPDFPSVLGPFDVFDARLFLDYALFDLSALHGTRSSSARLQARELVYRKTRETVVLAAASLYLRAAAQESRLEAIRAQLETAEALLRLADSRQRAGLVPAIEVLRAEVRQQADRQRLIAGDNRLAAARLRLARAIGLPPGQEFRLVDRLRFSPLAAPPLADAIAVALARRPDYRAQLALVAAAQAARRAAAGERLPTLELEGDYGEVGFDPSDTGASFQLSLTARLPLFQGGQTSGKILAADAELARLRAELADLEAAIAYQVETAIRDLGAAAAQVEVAERRLRLAEEQLRQASNRFAAGVASNIEVVQAQESLAAANDGRISSLLAHGIAKGSLVRALGVAESVLVAAIGGEELHLGAAQPGEESQETQP